MSPDPLMASGRVENPQTWNRYAYALNNPVNFIDPAPAIARRVVSLLGPARSDETRTAMTSAVFTSGRQPASTLNMISQRFYPRFDRAPLSP